MPNENTILDATSPPVMSKACFAGLRVLVVDDDADSREVLRSLLAAKGASVDVAESGQVAIGALRKKRFDLLLSDIGMPGMTGYQLMHTVRNAASNSWTTPPSVPALALTAFTSPADRCRALDAGFDEHIIKPVDIDALFAKIARYAARIRTGIARPGT